jgi:rare lipoprotein A
MDNNKDHKGLCRSWRLGVLAVILVLGVGCVPYPRIVPVDHPAPSPKTNGGKTEYESPDDYKNADADAWKGEMEGIASWYGSDFNGRLTASGEVYDMYQMTAAHKTLPLGTVVKVKNQDNGMETEVRINDRGPYVKGRIIDLSRKAGKAIGMRESGTAHVKLEVVRWPEKKRP